MALNACVPLDMAGAALATTRAAWRVHADLMAFRLTEAAWRNQDSNGPCLCKLLRAERAFLEHVLFNRALRSCHII